jgi:hypothetical protein
LACNRGWMVGLHAWGCASADRIEPWSFYSDRD